MYIHHVKTNINQPGKPYEYQKKKKKRKKRRKTTIPTTGR